MFGARVGGLLGHRIGHATPVTSMLAVRVFGRPSTSQLSCVVIPRASVCASTSPNALYAKPQPPWFGSLTLVRWPIAL